MKKYVLGFAFSKDFGGYDTVLLIKKNRPEWQAGHLNGVGGKVEEGEEFIDAMIREFKEETDLDSTYSDWTNFLTMKSDSFIVEVYQMVTEKPLRAKSMTDEKVSHYFCITLRNYKTISNIPWIVALALDKDSDRMKTVVEYKE